MTVDNWDAISNPEASGFYPTAQIGLSGKVEILDRPRCELCGLLANFSTPRLYGDIEERPYIDICLPCDRKYQKGEIEAAKGVPCYKICPACAYRPWLTDQEKLPMVYDKENHSMMCPVCSHVSRLPYCLVVDRKPG